MLTLLLSDDGAKDLKRLSGSKPLLKAPHVPDKVLVLLLMLGLKMRRDYLSESII